MEDKIKEVLHKDKYEYNMQALWNMTKDQT
jgi:hypothetical protein